MADRWTAWDQNWQRLTPHQKAAAMALMEADRRNPDDARNAAGAMINRAAKARQELGEHVSGKIYQPTIETAQQARLRSIIGSTEFANLADWVDRRARGLEADPVDGATHFLAPPSTMLALERSNPSKYKNWGPRGANWTGYDQANGQYRGTVLADRSHHFLAPEGRFSAPYSGQQQPHGLLAHAATNTSGITTSQPSAAQSAPLTGPAAIGQSGSQISNPADNPGHLFFDANRSYSRADIDQMIAQHGPGVIVGGNPEQPGHREAMAYAASRGANTHEYFIGPGEPARGYGGRGVAFPTDHTEIARNAKTLGMTRAQWDQGGWLDWHKQQLGQRAASGTQPYSFELDNINTLKPANLAAKLGDLSNWRTQNGITSRLALKNLEPSHQAAIDTGIRSGAIDKGMFAPFHFAEEHMSPAQLAASNRWAQQYGGQVLQTSNTRYYASPQSGFGLGGGQPIAPIPTQPEQLSGPVSIGAQAQRPYAKSIEPMVPTVSPVTGPTASLSHQSQPQPPQHATGPVALYAESSRPSEAAPRDRMNLGVPQQIVGQQQPDTTPSNPVGHDRHNPTTGPAGLFADYRPARWVDGFQQGRGALWSNGEFMPVGGR